MLIDRLISAKKHHKRKEPRLAPRAKDAWDKWEVVGGVAAKLLIPMVLLLMAFMFNSALKERDTRAGMVELAVGVLKVNPGDNPTADMKLVRQWAVKVLDRYSGVPMGEAGQVLQTRPLVLQVGRIVAPGDEPRGAFARITFHVATVDLTAKPPTEKSGYLVFYRRVSRRGLLPENSSSRGDAVCVGVSPLSIALPNGEFELWCAELGGTVEGEKRRTGVSNTMLDDAMGDQRIELPLPARSGSHETAGDKH